MCSGVEVVWCTDVTGGSLGLCVACAREEVALVLLGQIYDLHS